MERVHDRTTTHTKNYGTLPFMRSERRGVMRSCAAYPAGTSQNAENFEQPTTRLLQSQGVTCRGFREKRDSTRAHESARATPGPGFDARARVRSKRMIDGVLTHSDLVQVARTNTHPPTVRVNDQYWDCVRRRRLGRGLISLATCRTPAN